MPRTKGSKNRPKTTHIDYASQIAEKQDSIVSLTAEIASITANIDTLKADLKEKKTALKKAEKEVASLEAPRLWDVKNNRASGKSVEAQRINLAVDKIRVEVNRRYQELMQTDGYVTAAKLKDAYLGIGVKQETLLKLFEQHNAEFEKKVGHSRAQGTFTRYRTVCNHIREFLPHTYKREDIPLKELNLTFINDFEYFLRTEKKCRTRTLFSATRI